MKKILLAYDGSEAADSALQQTIDLAKAFKAEVGVVSVVPVHAGRIGIDPWDDRPVHDDQLREARTVFSKEGIEPRLHEPFGEKAPSIERVAEEGGYDTIVIGSRGLGAIGRLLEGSVSEHVATHARTNVVIAR
ncbi:MAG TPA: universal stress protein [Candidatus Limnocylindria bacterium]|jgi:nucleotide-binding universal stress UspA family protein|nr:universal stress protein [Candidatus Limnocylindria bacterium]